MHEILVNGHNQLAKELITFLDQLPNMHVTLIKDEKSFKQFIQGHTFTQFDYILDTIGNVDQVNTIEAHKDKETIFIKKDTLLTFRPMMNGNKMQTMYIELILNQLQDGFIFVNNQCNIQMINDAAKSMIGIDEKAIGAHILTVIPSSKIPNVLQRQEQELNKKLTLQNGKTIITSRFPLINEYNQLVGAFAIFKDVEEIKALAEQNTDLKEVKSMLEAIIHSSDEAISVVDENGKGLMINPAYTKITGLSEKDVIGKPATVDISEGESVHMEVLQTRRPVRGAKLFVGPHKREVVVNVAPIIVRGKLKGSVAVIHDLSNVHALTNELNRVKQIIRNLEATYTFEDIIGTSQEINIAIEQAKIAGNTATPVLLRGESGVGKELFAHAIHHASDRKHRKFIRVNCAAMDEPTLEKELFGYEKESTFSVEQESKKGLFEEANYGTIFLDEIGALSLSMQAKLLRVLQANEIMRLGGITAIPIDIKMIAATNKNLEKAITNKIFREDLYYRLNRLPIFIPPLRDRLSDFEVLVFRMMQKVNQLYGRNVQSITSTAFHTLKQYDWPGNIRELENVISRAVIFMDISEKEITADHLPPLGAESESADQTIAIKDGMTLQDATEQFEKEYIDVIYKNNAYNKTKTAKQLNISVRNLYYKLDKYGMG